MRSEVCGPFLLVCLSDQEASFRCHLGDFASEFDASFGNHRHFGTWKTTHAVNWKIIVENAVESYGGVPPYRETRAYIKRVLEYYRRYRADFEQLERMQAAGATSAQSVAERNDSDRASKSVPLASRVGP